MKKISAIILAAVMLISLVSCGKKAADSETAKNNETGTETVTAEVTTAKELVIDVGNGTAGTVYVDILCDLSVDTDIRADRGIASGIAYSFNDGESVYDALKAVTAANDIAVVDSAGYVTGIDGISTGDAGESSGWLFMQNGVMPTVGATDSALSDGDSVQWIYTADFNEYFK